MTPQSDYRLPRSVVPRHYQLTFVPDLGAAVFRGSEVVSLEVIETTPQIVLNSIELDINAASVVRADGEQFEATGIDHDPGRERVTLRFDEDLTPGNWHLHADFDGVLNDSLHGFYRSTYEGDDGEKRTIATTQFESTDARRAFPCWDEPDFKATFGVTLVVDEGLMAISNEVAISEEKIGDGKVEFRFADTMVMSTYLVAMVVGELVATDPVDVDGVPLRIVHIPGKEHLTNFALDAGAFALRYFTDYYGIPYPGGKMDMIGIPDFAWGAMENLGAITYRQTALLVDPETATQEEQARVADVIAHELAHQWFGDLVTMKWWNGVWLNEAFASFMETKCVEAYRPDWKRWLAFAPSRAHSMDIDALQATRPIEFPVESPDEAGQMFDTLTYGKGQAVLRMLEVYLGEEAFRRGIASYLARHAYSNTETSDLWVALEKESGEPVGEIMDGWIFAGGYPQLTVTEGGGTITVTQRQFRYLGGGDGHWQVPVLYTAGDDAGRVLIDHETSLDDARPLLLNRRGQGFYRVRYDGELFDHIVDRLAELSADERVAIVRDTFANVLTGDVAASDYLALVAQLGDETEPAVWGTALSGLAELDRIITSDARPWLQSVVRDLVGPVTNRLGWEAGADESALERQLRGVLIGARGNLGADPETAAEAGEVFEQWLADRSAVDGDVGAAAVSVVARNGSAADFDRFVGLYHAATVPQDETRFLRAAASVPDVETAARTLEMILTGDVRRQDATWMLATLLGHRDTGAATWELVKQRWDEVLAAPPPQTVFRMIALISHRSEPDVAADIEAWLADHPLPSGEKYAAQHVERMQIRVALREREASRLGPSAG